MEDFYFLLHNPHFLPELAQHHSKALFRSPKSCFAFEDIESLPNPPPHHHWKTVYLSLALARILFSTVSLQHNFQYCFNPSSSTIILCFSSSKYGKDLLELHLTGVKLIDPFNTQVVTNLHLTLRCTSPLRESSRSHHYSLQATDPHHFRFVKNHLAPNNQQDEMSEFLGLQGFCNFSSAVLQPILAGLKFYSENKQLRIDKNCINLV